MLSDQPITAVEAILKRNITTPVSTPVTRENIMSGRSVFFRYFVPLFFIFPFCFLIFQKILNAKENSLIIVGKYAIDAKNGDVLTFTMMGYATQTSKVGTASVYDVVLKDDTMYLEETVVIGYGTVRKKDLTGSVASVNSDKLKETIATNVDQMLQGKVAGVQITANSGAPGAASSIRVRGANSINNSKKILIELKISTLLVLKII